MQHKNLIYVLIIISFISCRRGGDASGKVINILNGDPVEGIKVHLDEYKIRALTDKTITRPINSTTTDANGEYSFKYGAHLGRANCNRLITLDESFFKDMDTVAVLDKKFEIGNYPGCKTVKWDYSGHSRKNQDFYIAPLSRIKVMPHNVTHIYDGMTLAVDLYDDNFSKTVVNFYNGNVTSTNYYTQFPCNGKVYISWRTVGFPSAAFYDTIYVAPFAKTTYHFNY